MTNMAMVRKKVAWGLILILILLSTALVVGCGGGDGGTGSMAVARGGHTATVLADGRILVAGGQGSGPMASAEVYDLSTGKWTSAGSMATPKYGHTTTLLKDGIVLSVGGSSADLYDSSTGTWISAGNMIYPRVAGHTSTLLEDGRVLVAGGSTRADGTPRDIAFAEVYDPSTGEWTLSGDMTELRTMHKAMLLKDGMVLVIGGRTTEVYDPTAGTWSPSGSLDESHGVDFTVTQLQDGRVLVAGGMRPPVWNRQSFATVDLYDPSTGEWSAAADLSTKRFGHTATLLKDGRVLVVGYHSSELYDADTGVWTLVGRMSGARGREHTATLLEDGRVLIIGGANITFDTYGREKARKGINSLEIYDPAKGW